MLKLLSQSRASRRLVLSSCLHGRCSGYRQYRGARGVDEAIGAPARSSTHQQETAIKLQVNNQRLRKVSALITDSCVRSVYRAMASTPVNCSAQQPCLTPLGAVSRRQQSSSRAVCSSSGAQSQRLLSGPPLQGVGRIYAATSRRQQKVCFGYCAIFC